MAKARRFCVRILVYEFMTGGGSLGDAVLPPLPASFSQEGAAMVTALAGDFAALDGVEVACLWDDRLAGGRLPGCRVRQVADARQERAAFAELARAADWTVVIAPECSGLLLDRCRRVQAAGGRLLGPRPDLVELAGDKQATADHLAAASIPVPAGIALGAGAAWPAGFPCPAVWKPRDGAGSQGIRFLAGLSSEGCGPGDAACHVFPTAGRLESFHPGLPASVSFLCGPRARIALPPCRQHLSRDGCFRYLGGSLPLEPALAERATRLAGRALATLAEPLGYLGVDLVLGDRPDGNDDVVMEINPRLTTSYVGLRAAACDNLAGAMLELAAGGTPTVSVSQRNVRFEAGGRVWCEPGH